MVNFMVRLEYLNKTKTTSGIIKFNFSFVNQDGIGDISFYTFTDLSGYKISEYAGQPEDYIDFGVLLLKYRLEILKMVTEHLHDKIY